MDHDNDYQQYVIIDPEQIEKDDNYIIVGVEDLDSYDEYVIFKLLYNIYNLVFRRRK
jgi:hypothetical protein